MNNPAASPRPRSSAPSGPLPAALREWCLWIYTQAELAHRTTPNRLTPDGTASTWLDYMGQASERPLMEAAMAAGVFEVVE
jgi:hypothetical protein